MIEYQKNKSISLLDITPNQPTKLGQQKIELK